ncbi:MAG: signal recognition particle protein [Planctomycetaceae bacterium]|nr:signal recognition particle protein [Planctomycetaceae bacterium]
MFESLQQGLQSAMKSLRGKGKLTEGNMRDGLQLIEQSLLEADVSFDVTKEFMGRVSESALGQKVLNSLDPSQQLVGIVNEELVKLMGPVDVSLNLKQGTTVLMMCGLQGSGKTTTCGKLARLLQKEGRKPMLAAADLQRPAAIDQLHVLGEQLGVPVHSQRGETDPVKVCREAVKAAKASDVDVLILDTAGRLAIDQELMDQLTRIDRQVGPDQALLVVDGMTGQDAVNSARAFNEALELDGVILTKLDGDARGGAVLSVKHVTGVPIKFIGTGEQLESLEPFRPEGMAGRILGMGDVVEMVRTAQQEFDQDQMAQTEERLRKGEFTLEDFRQQLSQLARPGLMQKLVTLMPGMGELGKMMGDMDTQEDMKRLFGIIDSMTPDERRNPKVIDSSRRRRIAAGSGVQHQEVNELIKQFDGMASIMKNMSGKGMGDRMKMVRELQQGGMMSPAGRLSKQKKTTGKRLTNKERAKLRQQREKELRRRKRRSK